MRLPQRPASCRLRVAGRAALARAHRTLQAWHLCEPTGYKQPNSPPAASPVPPPNPPPAPLAPNPRAAPAKGDPVVWYSRLYGRPNITDSAWHDDTPAFLEHGPITAMEMFRSERWHDPYIVRARRRPGAPPPRRAQRRACAQHWGSAVDLVFARGLPRARRRAPGHAPPPHARPMRCPPPPPPSPPLPCAARQGWHEGGELKGLKPAYGGVTNDDDLLFGAMRPHKAYNFTLNPREVRVGGAWGNGGREQGRTVAHGAAWRCGCCGRRGCMQVHARHAACCLHAGPEPRLAPRRLSPTTFPPRCLARHPLPPTLPLTPP